MLLPKSLETSFNIHSLLLAPNLRVFYRPFLSPSTNSIHYHELVFRLQCHERKAADFQRFFEDIMVRHDPTFTPVKPHGNQGDWKNDGWLPASGTVFQCYAPEKLDAAKLLVKIQEDFHGAKSKWSGKIKEWTFVYAKAGKLPPMVVSLIEELRSAHPEITIDTWNTQRLWQIVSNLSEQDRVSLLGTVPKTIDVVATTAEEIRVLLNFLARSDHAAMDAGTSLLDLVAKLERNRLGPSIRALIELGLPVVRTVANYLAKHPDPEFNSTVSQSLSVRYQELCTEYQDSPDEVFFTLILWTQSGKPNDLRFFGAAIGIVSHYFELCDIFES